MTLILFPSAPVIDGGSFLLTGAGTLTIRPTVSGPAIIVGSTPEITTRTLPGRHFTRGRLKSRQGRTA